MTNKTSKQLLIDIIKQYSVKTGGPFKLASGGESNLLIDLSTSLRTDLGFNSLCSAIYEELCNDFIDFSNIDAVGGPVCGSDLVSLSFLRLFLVKKAFGVRREPKNRGFDVGVITGNLNKGDSVLMVEDVCTTGNNLKRAIKEVETFGAVVWGVFTVVDRGGLKNINNQYKKYSLISENELK